MSFLFAAQGIDALKDQGELQRGILSVADESQEKSFPKLYHASLIHHYSEGRQ